MIRGLTILLAIALSPLPAHAQAAWSPLTAPEVAAIQAALRASPKPVSVVIDCSRSDCQDLADSLASAFSALGWQVISMDAPAQQRGLVVSLPGISQKAAAGAISAQRLLDATKAGDAVAAALPARLAASIRKHDLASIRITIGRQ